MQPPYYPHHGQYPPPDAPPPDHPQQQLVPVWVPPPWEWQMTPVYPVQTWYAGPMWPSQWEYAYPAQYMATMPRYGGMHPDAQQFPLVVQPRLTEEPCVLAPVPYGERRAAAPQLSPAGQPRLLDEPRDLAPLRASRVSELQDGQEPVPKRQPLGPPTPRAPGLDMFSAAGQSSPPAVSRAVLPGSGTLAAGTNPPALTSARTGLAPGARVEDRKLVVRPMPPTNASQPPANTVSTQQRARDQQMPPQPATGWQPAQEDRQDPTMKQQPLFKEPRELPKKRKHENEAIEDAASKRRSAAKLANPDLAGKSRQKREAEQAAEVVQASKNTSERLRRLSQPAQRQATSSAGVSEIQSFFRPTMPTTATRPLASSHLQAPSNPPQRSTQHDQVGGLPSQSRPRRPPPHSPLSLRREELREWIALAEKYASRPKFKKSQ